MITEILDINLRQEIEAAFREKTGSDSLDIEVFLIGDDIALYYKPCLFAVNFAVAEFNAKTGSFKRSVQFRLRKTTDAVRKHFE